MGKGRERTEVLQGTLDLLILTILDRGPEHGFGIMQRLGRLSRGRFQVTPGSLFPALQRLEENGWAKGTWGTSENNRKARFYAITSRGRAQLKREEERWREITVAVSQVLQGA